MGSYKIQFSRIGSNTLIINWPQIISIEISENINQFIDHIKANLYLDEVKQQASLEKLKALTNTDIHYFYPGLSCLNTFIAPEIKPPPPIGINK